MQPRSSIRDYIFDPEDPRAPSSEQWERMSPDERRRVVDMLPAADPVPFELTAKGRAERWKVVEELERRLAEEQQRLAEAQQRFAEVQQRFAEAQCQRDEAPPRLVELEQKLAEALAEIERLRRG